MFADRVYEGPKPWCGTEGHTAEDDVTRRKLSFSAVSALSMGRCRKHPLILYFVCGARRRSYFRALRAVFCMSLALPLTVLLFWQRAPPPDSPTSDQVLGARDPGDHFWRRHCDTGFFTCVVNSVNKRR